MSKAVVTGMIATYPVGGVAWDYGQYALGLERLGFDVYYLEDTGLPSYSYDDRIGGFVEDCRDGVRFLQESLELLSPNLAGRWHFRSCDGRTYGMSLEDIAGVIAGADLFVNISGGCLLREEYRRSPRKILIDTDPGWNHFVVFPRWDQKPSEIRSQGFRAHDHFFTYALRLGRQDCPLDSFGLTWHATVPPVVVDCWQPKPPGKVWSTVMMWNNYQKPIEYSGRVYGSKEREFSRFESIPSQTQAAFEVAAYAVKEEELPRQRWETKHWSVRNGRAVSRTAQTYRDYIESSRGEFSVAKNVYVATRSGWFSCRSVCYLAAGRPVIVQDTGFSEVLPTGRGLLAFNELEDAVSAVREVEESYTRHQSAAIELAQTIFNSDLVLRNLLSHLG